MLVPLPANLNVKKIRNDSKLYHQEMYYLIALIIWKNRERDLSKQGYFVNLQARYLKAQIGDKSYIFIKNYLIANNIIECDDSYCQGHKSLGFRLAEDYRIKEYIFIELNKYTLVKRIKKYRENIEKNNLIPNITFLKKCLKQVNVSKKLQKEKDFIETAKTNRELRMTRDNMSYFKIDKNGRVYSNLSKIPKHFRRRLQVNKEDLVEVDIVNSQPYFLLLFFFSKAVIYTGLGTKGETFHPDLLKYADLVSTGKFYQFIADSLKVSLPDAKKRVFVDVLFGQKHYQSKTIDLFNQNFPTLMKFIGVQKSFSYKDVANNLQRMESDYVINRVISNFRKLTNDAFVATIHDSLLVEPKNVDFAKQAIIEELSIKGVSPKVRVE